MFYFHYLLKRENMYLAIIVEKSLKIGGFKVFTSPRAVTSNPTAHTSICQVVSVKSLLSDNTVKDNVFKVRYILFIASVFLVLLTLLIGSKETS